MKRTQNPTIPPRKNMKAKFVCEEIPKRNPRMIESTDRIRQIKSVTNKFRNDLKVFLF